jgi:hypothetical protein
MGNAEQLGCQARSYALPDTRAAVSVGQAGAMHGRLRHPCMPFHSVISSISLPPSIFIATIIASVPRRAGAVDSPFA